MVGHHCRQQHMSKREQQRHQQQRLPFRHRQNLAQRTIHKDNGIEGRKDDYRRHHEHGTVYARHVHEPVVEQIHRIKKGKIERMPVGNEINLLPRHRNPRPTVISRHGKPARKQRVEASRGSPCPCSPVAGYKQRVEYNKHDQGDGCQPSLIFP